MALIDALRFTRDVCLSIPGYLGLNKYRIFFIENINSGEIIGTDETITKTSVIETEILVDGQRPTIREVKCQQWSGSELEMQEIEIILSKAYNLDTLNKIGGYLQKDLAPQTIANNVDFYIKIVDTENGDAWLYTLEKYNSTYITKFTINCKKKCRI